ncbi:hypothetical protein ACC754_45315, partial [Rhizobium johnstonii]|uniref:hypothetical protein n=1 Tax=Rhizobium johnstonii TaxID=3019933 RepID=UPI003F9DCA9E
QALLLCPGSRGVADAIASRNALRRAISELFALTITAASATLRPGSRALCASAQAPRLCPGSRGVADAAASRNAL